MAMKKVEENLLTCPICLDTYTDPKQLQCNHICCKECLSRIVTRDKQRQYTLICPLCRTITPVPAGNAANLQPALQTNQLLDIMNERKKDFESCPEHEGRELELYCETCVKKICYKCIQKGEKHSTHEHEKIKEAVDKYKKEIKSLELKPMENQLVTTERALGRMDRRRMEIFNQRQAIETNIHNTIGRLHEMLEIKKTELMSQLNQLTQTKFKSLAVQRDRLGKIHEVLSSDLHYVKENHETVNQGKILQIKSTVKHMKELTATIQPDLLEPNTHADMIFSTLADLTAEIKKYGRVFSKGSSDPSKCTVTGQGMEVAAVGEKYTTLLQTISFDNQPSKETAGSITCELVSEMTGVRVVGTTEEKGQGQYEISYKPILKGRHQLHIKVRDQDIRGSPFPVTARSPVEKLDLPVNSIPGVNYPVGVAVNQRGEVVVVERGKHRVSVFSSDGNTFRSFGSYGPRQGQFAHPYGVAVDSTGSIFVADKGNHRIQKFSAERKFLTAVGTKGSGPLQFIHPHGITYNASNDKVYVVDENSCIQILNSDLSYYSCFGKKGKGKGRLESPQHLACDSSGNVYVADHSKDRIQVFTAEGKFLRKLGDNIKEPFGLAIDSDNRIYVSESGNHHISVFTSEGRLVKTFGRKGSGPGQFDGPTGLAVDSSGVVYVCDFQNNRLQIL